MSWGPLPPWPAPPCRLRNLQDLKIKCVRFSVVQAFAGLHFLAQLTSLRRLELKNNGFSFHELPDYFSSLTRLTRLMYASNKLRSIPAFITRLAALEVGGEGGVGCR